jgi:large subunit ribosomal protein L29
MKKVTSVRELSVEELKDRITEAQAELSKEKAHIASGTRAEKPAKIKNLRRSIARMFTVIKEKG